MSGRNDEKVQGRAEETGGLSYPDAEDIISDYTFVIKYFIPPQTRWKARMLRGEIPAKLQAIVDKMKAVQGKDVFYRAALLVSEINEQSLFVVGNKKISLIAMDIFLQQNKIKLESNEEIVDSMASLMHNNDIEKFAGWLRDHSKPA